MFKKTPVSDFCLEENNITTNETSIGEKSIMTKFTSSLIWNSHIRLHGVINIFDFKMLP